MAEVTVKFDLPLPGRPENTMYVIDVFAALLALHFRPVLAFSLGADVTPRTYGTGCPWASYTSTGPSFAKMSRTFDASPTATICKRDRSQYFRAAARTCSGVIAATRAGYVVQ